MFIEFFNRLLQAEGRAGSCAMDIQQLTAFDRIVREGSFSRAARQLNIAQPTITSRIQVLEEEVGGPLLERSNQGVKLTALGVSFLPYARQALAAMIEGTIAVQEARLGQRGRLTIGALGSLAEPLLAPALLNFLTSHPTVECYVRAADHLPMMELLYDGVVELAIVAWPCVQPLRAEIQTLLHFHEAVPFVVPQRHASQSQADHAGRNRVNRHAISTFALVAGYATATLAHCRSDSSRGGCPCELAIYLARRGYGCGFFPQAFIERELKSGELVELHVTDLAALHRDSALVRIDRKTPLAPAAEALVLSIRTRAAQLGILVE